jgi:hypothetical protein
MRISPRRRENLKVLTHASGIEICKDVHGVLVYGWIEGKAIPVTGRNP